MKKILLALAASAFTLSMGAQAPAFPGAEGHARYTTTGGRGGKVLHVTNLNDSGSGSLRQALQVSSGPRIIVFDVSGTIELQSALNIVNGDVTVMGQTAPGDGICLKNYETVVKADNVILRFLRFRPGDGGDASTADGRDAIWGRYHKNIIIDHCSMSWCVDECGSFYENDNFTMQWCLLAESMKLSLHSKDNHGYGGIWGGHSASFHHNMLTCHDSRNPRMAGSRLCGIPDVETVDMRNCVVNNWGQTNSGYSGEGGNYNLVNNYYKSGPATKSSIRYRIFQASADNGDYAQEKGVYGHFYVSGNYMEGKGAHWDWSGIDIDTRNNSSMTKASIKSDSEFAAGTVTTHSAEQAWQKVLRYAGASHRRDTLDRRYAAEAQSGKYACKGSKTGLTGIIDSPADAGGYPLLSGKAPATDSDGDGMPDAWETANGLDPHQAADATTYTLDPKGYYTNIEVYCNSLVDDLVKAQNADAESSVDEYYPETARADGIDYYDGLLPASEDTEQAANAVALTIAQSTHGEDASSSEWTFDGGVTVSNNAGKAYSTGKEDGVKYSAGTTYTITLPDSVSIDRVTITGYDNYASTDAYLKELCGEEYAATQYVYPQKSSDGNYIVASHTIEFDTPVRGSLTFTPAGKQVVWVITLAGTKDQKKVLRGDINKDGVVNILDVVQLVNIVLGNQ